MLYMVYVGDDLECPTGYNEGGSHDCNHTEHYVVEETSPSNAAMRVRDNRSNGSCQLPEKYFVYECRAGAFAELSNREDCSSSDGDETDAIVLFQLFKDEAIEITLP